MSHDPLSDVLRSVHLRGAVFFDVTCRGDWVAESPPARALGPEVLPGAEHVLGYHLFLKGQGWAATDGRPPVNLRCGDIVMFPHGDAHVLSSAPGLRARRGDDGSWLESRRDEPKPIPVTYRGDVAEPGRRLAPDELSTAVVCGFIGCDLRPFNPLIEALPRLLHLAATDVGAWVAPMLEHAVAESRARRAGSAAVLERLSEMVFVDSARRYLDSLPPDASGWLAALRDRHVGRTIALMHERPAEAWTVDELGRQVGLSRSALHERFVALVGHPPMHYLTQWRMQRGAAMLREGRATVATIAQEVGYDSEAAFARAFKRSVGLPPAAWRRARRDPAAAGAAARPSDRPDTDDR